MKSPALVLLLLATSAMSGCGYGAAAPGAVAGNAGDETSAASVQGAAAKARKRPGPSPQQILDKWDKNHNGRIDESEAAAMNAALAENPNRPLVVFDTNGDGKLDDSEIAALNARIAAYEAHPAAAKTGRQGARNGQGAGQQLPPDPVGTGTATISWKAPTQNTDGSPIKDLAGYVVRYGTAPTRLTHRVVVDDPQKTEYVVTGLGAATWYFSVAAINRVGVESAAGPVVSKTIAR